MDHWEAHYLVKRELEAINARAMYSTSAGVPFDETAWIGKLWLQGEDD